MTATAVDSRVGRTIAERYYLLERIVASGTSVIYRGIHLQTRRDLAVKLLRPEFVRLPATMRRFRREAEFLGSFDHRHIIDIVEAIFDGDDCFLVMPLLIGESLDQRIRRLGRIPWSHARVLLQQLCDAVAHAHRRGVVHRDLKPANCFLESAPDGSDHLRLLDFGIGRLLNPTGARLTAAGDIVGSPGFLAPEQVMTGDADARTNVYAAGATLFCMLTGRPPFVERSVELVVRLTGEDAPTLSQVAPGLDAPSHVERAVARALARDPQDRFPDIRAFACALRGSEEHASPSTVWLPWLFWIGLPLVALVLATAQGDRIATRRDAYGSPADTGTSVKLRAIGGLSACHSSERPPHGFCGAGRPRNHEASNTTSAQTTPTARTTAPTAADRCSV